MIDTDIWGIFFFLILLFYAIAFLLKIIEIIGRWKMFRKANQPGWPALIPFYDQYIQCKITGVNPWWILIVLVGLLLSFIPGVGQIFYCVIAIYYGVLLSVSTANAYGKDISWAIGLFFLGPFFLLALGLGKSEYMGINPMKDPILEIKNDVKPVISEDIKYCSYCGEKQSQNNSYCINCGNKI